MQSLLSNAWDMFVLGIELGAIGMAVGAGVFVVTFPVWLFLWWWDA